MNDNGSEITREDEVQEITDGVKKMQMTKAQKRRMWNHAVAGKFGEKVDFLFSYFLDCPNFLLLSRTSPYSSTKR